jgi:hypothetical protein
LLRRTQVTDAKESLRKIKDNLKNILVKTIQPDTKSIKSILRKLAPPTQYTRAGLDIAVIGAIGFYYNFKRRTNELFSTSFYKIDRLIKDRLNLSSPIKKKLAYVPEAYRDFMDIFSKIASDRLPPHRSYDYKIVLEKENILTYSPLYKISLEELETLK